MKALNKTMLIGNVGDGIELRHMPNGTPVVNVNLATDESYKDRATGQLVPATEWHRVVIFGKRAEVAHQYLRKGSRIYIEGKNKTRRWEDQAGVLRFTTEVVVGIDGEMIMLDRPPQKDERPTGGGNPQSAQGEQACYDNLPPGYEWDGDIPCA